ncbi:hypothetical protein GCM10028820_29800 [Tessaracoccus terricola]
MSDFDESSGPDDGLFFAGIGAEDEPADEEDLDEDAVLGDTKVRSDDEPTGSAPMPLIGMGAGAGGAGALGAYAGQTREGGERSRSGAAGAAPVAHLDSAHEGGGNAVDPYGRVVDAEDPWGVGDDDDVPTAFVDTTATEAPRTRTGSGTRGGHLARNDGAGGGGMVPGATLGGIGGMPNTQAAAATTAANTSQQQGGIPLSVLQNLQNNRASGAAFAPPMTGVQASGSSGYMADPSLVVVQAFGQAEGVDATSSDEWLRAQLREHDRAAGGGIATPAPGLEGIDDPDQDDTDDDSRDEAGGGSRNHGRDGAVAGGAGAAGVAGWGGGSSTSGAAPVTGGASGGGQTSAGSQHESGWGWNPSSGQAPGGGFTGSYAAGSSGVESTTFVPGGAGGPSSAGNDVPSSGGAWHASAAWSGDGQGTGSRDHYGPGQGWTGSRSVFATGSDFSVSSEELARDAEHWRRIAVEMEAVHSVTRSVRDGESSFGLVSEPAGAYSRATQQTQAWSARGARAYEELADQLNATAAGYNANEQSAVDGTGRVFDA